MIRLMLITNSPEIAAYAVSHGVDRIFVDLEINGKLDRQGHLDTVVSRHRIEDVSVIRAAIPDKELLVRLNPLYKGTKQEIEQAIDSGADSLMLPMFRSSEQVEQFCEMVDGRAAVVPLVETPDAVDCLPSFIDCSGVTEIYVGLNDLHLALGMSFMFEPLANGTMDDIASISRAADVPFGFGGIARVGEGMLPAEKVLGEHIRLGSSSVILSRTFHRRGENVKEIESLMSFGDEIEKLRKAELEFRQQTIDSLMENRNRVAEIVNSHVAKFVKHGSK